MMVYESCTCQCMILYDLLTLILIPPRLRSVASTQALPGLKICSGYNVLAHCSSLDNHFIGLFIGSDPRPQDNTPTFPPTIKYQLKRNPHNRFPTIKFPA